ncbi:MAG: PIN domain-containing protein [Chloroflexota bacterium]
MIRAFIDASVLFAASYSSTGASRETIRLAFQRKVMLVISDDVLEEAEKNLALKYPATLEVFYQIIRAVPFEKVTPTTEDVQQAASYSAVKDAPIVAAAKRAKVDYLVSLDRHHLVNVPEVAQRSGLKILLPEEFLERIRKQAGNN